MEIKVINNNLVLIYSSDYSGWIEERIKTKGYVKLKETFTFTEKHIIEKTLDEELGGEFRFLLGEIDGDYYKLDKSIIGTKNQFYFHKDILFELKHFCANKNVSILQKIDHNIETDFYLGGNHNNSIPIEVFRKLIKAFPNYYELRKYVDARITSILSDNMDFVRDSESSYNKYLNKKTKADRKNILKLFKTQDEFKLKTILDKLEAMLKNEVDYSENQWQEEIVQIILLLFPKYISVFKEAGFKDIYNNKFRRLDYVLIDYAGHVDIVEIKKPFDNSIMSASKYRDNYIPRRELSGTIMQIEKYIYYLNKSGMETEKSLTEKFKTELPEKLDIKIVNPRGMIIMGRTLDLSGEQLNDFEIVKRKYKNVMDIFTYDDLIDRIKISIEQVKKI
jgi:hypothetical protein